MCKKIESSFLVVLFIASLTYAFTGGDGTADNPYQISTRADLEAVNNDLAANYIMINDIDLTGTIYTQAVISPDLNIDDIIYTYEGAKFAGSFNGNGFKINNLTKMQITFADWDFFDSEVDGLHDVWYMSASGYPELHIFSSSYQPRTLQGGGTVQSPYLIYDKYDLIAVNQVNASNCKLMADIDLLGVPFIGVPVIVAFAGTFDGNGHSLRNLTITGNGSYIGLFGITASGAIIKNLGVEECNISGDSYVGGLAGLNYSVNTNCGSQGSVSGASDYVGGLVGHNAGSNANCYTKGSVSGTGYYAGGLIGYNAGINTNCYSTDSVSGSNYVGGLAGDSVGTITNCSATGSVSGTGDYVGGLVGYNGGSNTNCYSTGSVSGSSYVGGLAGDSGGTITNCYAAGAVGSGKGGLVGLNHVGSSNCFWDIQSSGVNVAYYMAETYYGPNGCMAGCYYITPFYGAAGIVLGKTTAEMKTQSTFTSAGWDYTNVWKQLNGSYPILQWQQFAGDFDGNGIINIDDFMVLADQWLGQAQEWQGLAADINGDGTVDMADFAIMASVYGQS